MLTQIHIRDFITIETLKLDFDHGCTMITGETGAGKSIFIEAIELTLGTRISQNMIRQGKDKADISLCFDIENFPAVISYLKNLELYTDNNECIIRRIITLDGRSRCYINGSPSPLHLVKELGELLFHLHGQHAQHVLIKAEKQREILDRFADHLPLVSEVKEIAQALKSITQQIKNLQEKSTDRANKIDYLRFQLNELDSAKLSQGEWESLELEHHKLTHTHDILKHIQRAAECISHDEEQNIIALLNEARKNLESVQKLEPSVAAWTANLNACLIQLTDLSYELHQMVEKIGIDGEKISQIETRISELFDLGRKHKITPNELPHLKENIETELGQLTGGEEELLRLVEQQQTLEKNYHAAAQKLSLSRQKAAVKLAKTITQTIRSLSLPHGEFNILLENESSAFASFGYEKIVFQIKTMPDQPLQPINKIISGGELSRLSLATHLALSHKTNIPILVFDEVDTGLGGATAEKIGKLLRNLGETYQVFCVTHQARVAALGHHHLLVEKKLIAKTTQTQMHLLTTKEKTQEIARMLGGEKITQKTLDHAHEILEIS